MELTKEIEEALGLSEPRCTYEILEKLIEAAEILLHEKDYDGHGWELIEGAVREGKGRLVKIDNLHHSLVSFEKKNGIN